jgi:hypothetical protein
MTPPSMPLRPPDLARGFIHVTKYRGDTYQA